MVAPWREAAMVAPWREAAMVSLLREAAGPVLRLLAVERVAMGVRDVRRAVRPSSARPAARRRHRIQPARRERSGQLPRCDRPDRTRPYSCALPQMSKNKRASVQIGSLTRAYFASRWRSGPICRAPALS